MRKYFVYLLALLTFSLLIGCSQISDLKVPKKVKIKANPEYHLNIGAIDLQLYEDGSLEKMVDDTLVYKPEGYSKDEIRLLKKFPIMEVPMDVSSYLDNIGISDKVTGISFEQKIEIPDFKVSQNMDVNLDTVNDRIVNLVMFGGLTTEGTLSANFETEESFETMTFASGTLVIEAAREVGANEVVTISYNGKEVTRGQMKGKYCYLDLKDKTIYRHGMSFDFSPSKDSTNWFTAVVKDGVLSSVTGLDLNPIDVPFSQVISTKASFSSFESCTIKEGQIDLSLNIDKSWDGVNITYPVTLDGGITGSSKTVNGNEIIDFNDKVLLPEDTTVTSNVSISFKKGKINFTKNPVISFETNIKTIKEVSLILSEFDSSTTQSIALGDDVYQLVRQFDLGKSVINGVYTNTLPEGNDSIRIKFVSDFLGFNCLKDLKSNVVNEKITLVAEYDSHIVNINKTPTQAGEFNAIDLNFNASLPGSTPENQNKVKLVNVEIGETYLLKFDIDQSDPKSIDYKWNKIVLNLEDMNLADSMDTGFSKSMFSDSFKDLIKTMDGSTPEILLDEVSVYLYCVKPEKGFKDISVSGVVKTPTDEGDVYILGDETSGKKLLFTDKLPELEYEDGAVITDISACTGYLYINIADTINKLGNSNFVVDYDISCSFGNDAKGFTITSDEVEAGKSSNISVMMYIIIPLKFGFANDVCIDLTDLLSLDSDLLGRKSTSTETENNDFLKYFESAKINYRINELPISCNGLKFVFNPYGNDSNHIDDTKESGFSVGGRGSIEISDMQSLLNVYPLIPIMRLEIPGNPNVNDSWISIASSGRANLSLDLEIKANAEIEKSLWR